MELTNFNKDRKKGRKPAIDISTMVYGKVPPQAKDLEEAVLGALMLDKTAFDIVNDILVKESFYADGNQRIFEAIQKMNFIGIPVDILTVVEELKKTEQLDMVGGPYYVTKLTNAVVSTANVETHARIVQQKFIQRELIRVAGEIIGDAYEDNTDCFDLLDDAEAKIDKINAGVYKNDVADMPTCSKEFSENLDKKRNRQDELSGVPTGFRELDICTHGWQSTDLIVLAARPSVGKTALSINFAVKAASHPTKPTPVALFNLEMSRGQLMERIVSAWSEINYIRVRRGKLDDDENKFIHEKVMPRIERLPLYIDQTSNLNVIEFRAKARRLVNKHKVGLIIIDYLQLMGDVKDGEKRNREQQISNITRNLKRTAKDLNVPIIALSQLSRAVETRKEKVGEPVLSDLRESGAIEQDADLVAFIYRPEYYEQQTDIAGETFIKIAKHRNGTLEKIKLIGKLHIQKFYDPEDERIKDGKLIVPATGFKSNNFDEGIKDLKYQF